MLAFCNHSALLSLYMVPSSLREYDLCIACKTRVYSHYSACHLLSLGRPYVAQLIADVSIQKVTYDFERGRANKPMIGSS